MSEFSSSIHFIGNDVDSIVKFMEDRDISGIILGTNGKTVSVLIGWDEKIRDKIYNEAKFIDYQYGDDHGIWIRFFDQGKVIAKIAFAWGDDFEIEENDDFEPGVTKDISKVLLENNFIQAEIANDLSSLVERFDPDDWESTDNFVDEIGDLLGFFAFRWISYDCFLADSNNYNNTDFPDLVLVNLGEK